MLIIVIIVSGNVLAMPLNIIPNDTIGRFATFFSQMFKLWVSMFIQPRKVIPQGLPFQLNDYLELVDWSGRILCENKKGAIADKLPGILQRLDMDAKQFIYLTRNFEQPFKGLVGAAHHVRKACESIGQN